MTVTEMELLAERLNASRAKPFRAGLGFDAQGLRQISPGTLTNANVMSAYFLDRKG